jgi:hypothetical protein
MADQQVPITMAEVTDPDELAKARAHGEGLSHLCVLMASGFGVMMVSCVP